MSRNTLVGAALKDFAISVSIVDEGFNDQHHRHIVWFGYAEKIKMYVFYMYLIFSIFLELTIFFNVQNDNKFTYLLTCLITNCVLRNTSTQNGQEVVWIK